MRDSARLAADPAILGHHVGPGSGATSRGAAPAPTPRWIHGGLQGREHPCPWARSLPCRPGASWGSGSRLHPAARSVNTHVTLSSLRWKDAAGNLGPGVRTRLVPLDTAEHRLRVALSLFISRCHAQTCRRRCNFFWDRNVCRTGSPCGLLRRLLAPEPASLERSAWTVPPRRPWAACGRRWLTVDTCPAVGEGRSPGREQPRGPCLPQSRALTSGPQAWAPCRRQMTAVSVTAPTGHPGACARFLPAPAHGPVPSRPYAVSTYCREAPTGAAGLRSP